MDRKSSTSPAGAPPRVSIGLPIKDGAAYLPSTLDSLLGQTFRDFELVVSDNGSTDATPELCRRAAARDPRVRYHRVDEDRGVMWNFWRVVELARGEYFKWASHDDIAAPEFLERCVAVMDADPGVVCCHSRTQKIDRAGRPVPGLPDPTRASDGGELPRPSQRFRDVLRNTGYAVRCYGLIRREALEACGRLLPVYGSEKILMAELALHGRYHDLEDVLFFERVHAAASSSLTSKEAQQVFADPSRSGRSMLPRLQLLGGYVAAVRRVPLPAAERLRCAVALVGYLFQWRKWGGVARSVVRGSGAVRYEPPIGRAGARTGEDTGGD